MTREEYLSALKNEIMSLTQDEQAEALQYYSDFFEEANDDEKVIAELGTPEELAKTITAKFANAVVPTESDEETEETSSSNKNDSEYGETVLYYSFENNDVRNLDLSFGIAQVVMIKGEHYAVETRGISANDLSCHLSAEGTLCIANNRKVNFSFFSHDRGVRFVPRVLITVPSFTELNKFALKMGAGDFKSKDVDIKCSTGAITVGAGSVKIGSVKGGELDFRCGMGSLEFKGSVTGNSDLDCGMGNLKLSLEGNEEDYSYDLKLGIGDFKINKDKRGGFYQSVMNGRKKNHFSVNCGMGSVNIKIK